MIDHISKHIRNQSAILVIFSLFVVACSSSEVSDRSTNPKADPPSTPLNDTEVDENSTLRTIPQHPNGTEMSFEILETVDHDPASFTQGYERYKNSIVESSGGYGTSSIQLTDFETGQVLQRQTVADTYFAEGLTVVDDTVVQLTWREETAFRWRVDDLTPLESWPYQGEGWGLCDDGADLWMSNGSAQLTRRNRTTFAPLEIIDVTLDDEPVTQLNELECVDDLIMANVWQSETIVVIDPDTGSVTATIDLASIMPPSPPGVANGIAALGDGTLLLTGKNWPEASVVKLTAP